MNRIGLVAIGRNEGQKLRQCLLSALAKMVLVVYVDSDSTDGSVELARSLGVDVLNETGCAIGRGRHRLVIPEESIGERINRRYAETSLVA